MWLYLFHIILRNHDSIYVTQCQTINIGFGSQLCLFSLMTLSGSLKQEDEICGSYSPLYYCFNDSS